MSEATLEAPAETRTDPAADAAAAESQEVVEPVFETADDYLAHISGSKEGESASEPEPRPALRPSVLSDPRAGQYIQDYRNAHENRQRETDAVAQELADYGVPENMARRIVKEFKDRLNSHHADGLRLSGYEAAATAVQYEQSHIQDAIAQALPKPLLPKLQSRMDEEIKANGVASYQMVMKTIVDLARDGFVSDKDNKAAIKAAFEEGRKQALRQAPTIDKSNGAAGRVQPTAIRASGVKWTTKREARDLHAQDKISTAEMRRINADPTIPDGY